MTQKHHLFVTTSILLVAAVAILTRVADLSMQRDEVFSVLHAGQTPAHIIGGIDVYWPPGYNLVLHYWMRATGENDVTVRWLGGLCGIVAIAGTYRAGRRLHSRTAGWLAALAFGTSGYAVYFFTEARGYTLSLMLIALLVWLHLRWLRRPTGRRALPYALVQTLLVYVHFANLAVIALAGLHTLMCKPRRLLRWLGIVAITGIAGLPLLPQFLLGARLRNKFLHPFPPYYRVIKPGAMYTAYSAHQDLLFALIVLTGGFGLAWMLRQAARRRRAALLWLLCWGVGVPVFAYLTRVQLVMFTTRYLVFTMPAVFLLVGWGLAALPKPGRWAGGALLIALALAPWQPFSFRLKYEIFPPIRDLVRAMAEKFEPGDVMVVDPNLNDKPPSLFWQYFEALYFPGGRIPYVEDGYAAAGSLWYLRREGTEDPATQASVAEGRIRTNEFWGPPYFIATHYEKPPLTPGYALGSGGLRFRGARITPAPPYMPETTVQVETWWSTDAQLPLDYSFGLFLIRVRDGTLHAESNGGPSGVYANPQTSQWAPDALYRDDRTITIALGMDPETFEIEPFILCIAVYNWQDGQRLVPEPGAPQYDNCLILDRFEITSWAAYEP